jgi:hypothetical protein
MGDLLPLRSPLHVTTLCAVVGALLLPLGCSSFNPRVGPAEQRCAEVNGPASDNPLYSWGGDGGTYAYSPPAAATPVDGSAGGGAASCPTPAGSWCDDCESMNCCETRLACYGDPTCAAADKALDACLNGAPPDGGAACLDAFVRDGQALAQARLECQRSCCSTACAAP